MDALELAKQAKKRNIIDMAPQSFAIWQKNGRYLREVLSSPGLWSTWQVAKEAQIFER